MNTFSHESTLLTDTLQTGAIASLATTVATVACGAIEDGNGIAPINAVSHIVWGDESAAHDQASWKYTATGLVLNTVAVTSWAGIYEVFFGDAADRKDVPGAILGGIVISTLAFATDYFVVPKRFTPGFEKRVSSRSLFAIYTMLALGLAFGSLSRTVSRV